MKATVTDKRKLQLLAVISLALIALYVLVGLNADNWRYALSLRLPKTLAIILTGAAIAYSTTVFQTITVNRVLTPSIMGLDALYLFTQTVLVFFFGSRSVLFQTAHINFFLSVGLMMVSASVLYRFLFGGESRDIYFSLLVGVILGTLLQSAASFLRMVMDPNEFLILQGRMFASFNNVNTALLLPAAVVVIPILLAGKGNLALLDVLALGREQAINLGVDYERNVRRLLTTVVVFVSAATGLVGPITFLGLLTANLARELIRSYQHRYLLTASILIGIITLVGGQFVVERLFNFAAPLSVFINLGGGVYFVYLLLRGSQS